MYNRIFAVDAGKYATKAMGEDRKLLFRSKYTKVTGNKDIPLEHGNYRVTFDDATYILGDMGQESDYELEKQSLLHKMAIYTAIAKLGGREDVRLAIGCPVSIFMSDTNRKEYAEFIKEAPTRFKVDDVSIKVDINKIVVLPEGAGVIYSQSGRYENERVAVIDLGGRNMNFTIYNDLKPQVSSMLSTNNGSMEIETMVKKAFETKYRIALENEDVSRIIQQGGLKHNGQLEGEVLLKGIFEEFVENSLSMIKKFNFNLGTMEVVFTGGTSLLVAEQLLKHVPHGVISENAQWNNVEGFYKIARGKFYER
jgi:plasmid segregation protein ParM